ncbi:vWA domain-containing protein [Paludisphaera mucosa]|uniref:VWA domain-containing protein n=1 Tax=Paludisphaera mucosa TaxID=3030827 RepID=A0ABT6FFM2_9BACT|nr:vWA domain-containing protein [Paludisphaera mucosa]MDG3006372.1 VWA domain-containing protein [Paludisphaera mucosa]
MSDANETLNAYILLDRSGSMASRWDEALGSINTYVKALAGATVTLATFDGMDGLKFEVLRDRVPSTEWKDVTPAEATPRGETPLYDALGRIISTAEAAGADRTVIVVMTDGVENHSREVSKYDVYDAVDRCKSKGWQFVFLGADFDAFRQASHFGLHRSQTLRMKSGGFPFGFERLARKTTDYATTGQDIAFTEEEQKEAEK